MATKTKDDKVLDDIFRGLNTELDVILKKINDARSRKREWQGSFGVMMTPVILNTLQRDIERAKANFNNYSGVSDGGWKSQK